MGVADRREREKEQRRNQIVDAAEKLFFTRGVGNTSIDDIANAAELSKGTIYLYFKSKEEMYIAIVIRGLRLLNERFSKVLTEKCCGLKKLYGMGSVLLEYSRSYPGYFEAVFYHNLAIAGIEFETHPELFNEMQQLSEKMYMQTSELISEGIADGSIRPGIDVHKTAMSMYALITGLIRVVNLEADHLMNCHHISPEELIQYSFDLIKHSLQSEKLAKEGCIDDCTTHLKKLKTGAVTKNEKIKNRDN